LVTLDNKLTSTCFNFNELKLCSSCISRINTVEKTASKQFPDLRVCFSIRRNFWSWIKIIL